jgi:hypothetical protein
VNITTEDGRFVGFCSVFQVYAVEFRKQMKIRSMATIYIVARMRGDYYKTGIGLTTGFIGSQTVTHNYRVYTSQLTLAAATLL